MSWSDKVGKVDDTYMDRVEADAKAKGGGGDIKWIRTPENGKYIFRVLPAGLDGKFAFKLAKHYDLPNPDQKDAENPTIDHICIEHSFPEMKRECPVCQVIRDLAKLGALVDPYEVQVGAYFNVLVHMAPPADYTCNCPSVMKTSDVTQQPVKVTTHTGVHLLKHTEYTMTWFNQQRRNRDEFGDILSPVDGRNLVITRSKEKGRVSYERILSDKCAIATDEAEIEKILDSRFDFSKIWKFPDDEIMSKIIDSAKMLRTFLQNRLTQPPQILMPPIMQTPAPAGTSTASPVVIQPVATNNATATPATTAAPVPTPTPAVALSSPSSPPVLDAAGNKIIYAKANYPDCYALEYKKDTIKEKQCLLCAFDFMCREDKAKIEGGGFILKRLPA